MNPAKTFPAETQRIVEHLRDLFRREGRGAMVRVARQLGLHDNYFSELTRRERFDAGCLTTTLRELGVSPATFFAELEGDPGGVGFWGRITERSTPETLRAVHLAYRRMRSELPSVDLVAELEDAEDVPITTADKDFHGAAWLDALDSRRQDAPERVESEIEADLHLIEPAQLPRALGAWGSALCLMLELETAAFLNRCAIQLAEAAGDSATVADLYLRRSYIIADTGDHRHAVALARMATGLFASLGKPADEGRALVDTGRWLYYLNRHSESIAAFRRALELLPETEAEARYRIASLQTLGLVYLELEKLDLAEECASRAAPLLHLATGPQDRAKLSWFRASICRRRGRLTESEKLFRKVVDAFENLHPGEATLASLELVEVILEQGKIHEAWQVCLGMFPFEEKNPIISSALADLLRSGINGLRIDRVRRAKEELENAKRNARTRREWRALNNQNRKSC